MPHALSRSLVIIALSLFATSLSRAAEPSRADTDKANALFRDGRELMDAGNYAQACPKLEESLRLAPRVGTMLNLGGCFERRGQLARALRVYERAATMAREANRADREKSARDLAAALEPKVAKLALEVAQVVDGLIVDVDGEALPLGAGVVPIDPGKRVLRARAPGKKTFTTTIQATAGATVRASIPALGDDAASTGAPVAATDDVSPLPKELQPVNTIPDAAPPSSLRTVGIIGGLALGVVGVGVGTVFGLEAKSKHEESEAHCRPAGCFERGITLIDEAKTASTISTISFAAGAVGLVVAAVCWFALPSSSSTAAGTRASRGVRFAPNAAGGFGGSF